MSTTGSTIAVTDDNFAAEVEQGEGLILVDFWAEWCGPCKMIAPTLEQLASEYAGKVTIAKLDVDTNQKTSMKFNVRSIPSLLFFKDGKHVDTVVGLVPKATLTDRIQKHLGDTGTLYVVATPLGHLGDLSLRAAELLRTVPVVAAEDTRHTRNLLSHLGASPRLISYHGHSDARRLEALLEILLEGRDVALVSDAGTPLISDPGAELVAAVRAADLRVVPVPGPSAVAAVLSAAGMPADRYLFLGFVPRKGAERRRLLSRAAAEEWTTVFYEAPGRLASLLADLASVAGPDRQAVVAREVTKIHEEFRTGSLEELLVHFQEGKVRGEITVVLRGTGQPPEPPDRTEEAGELAAELLAAGHSRKETVRMVVEALGVARNDAYRIVMELP